MIETGNFFWKGIFYFIFYIEGFQISSILKGLVPPNLCENQYFCQCGPYLFYVMSFDSNKMLAWKKSTEEQFLINFSIMTDWKGINLVLFFLLMTTANWHGGIFIGFIDLSAVDLEM